jgi:hypothetical protein
MKKIISIFLAAVVLGSLIIVFAMCDKSNNDDNNEVAKPTTNTCSHSYILEEQTANCTTGGYATYKCSLCNASYEKYENALGHTTDNGECARCGQTFGVWEEAFYVDEFNTPTNEAYIRNSEFFIGVFSNSATTNSKLYAMLLIDSDSIAIKLWEYGSQLVNAYSTTYYDITILDDNGRKHYTTGTMYKNGERIFLKDKTFISLLKKNQKLKVYIEEDSEYGYNTTYLFEVINGNFNTIYSSFIN